MAQFNRVFKLTVGKPGEEGFVIENLAISFSIAKDLTRQTNKSSINIYNLAQETLEKIKPDMLCILEVGYEEDIGLVRVFIGYITYITTKEENGEQITTLEISDGQVPLRDTIISVGYSAGISGEKIVRDIAAEMGLLIRFGEGVTFAAYPTGFSYIGQPGPVLNKVCNASGCTWTVQNNELQITKNKGTTGVYALVFSAESGLIGSPERIHSGAKRPDSNKEKKKKQSKSKDKKDKKEKGSGWKITTLLAPSLNAGDAIKLEAKHVKGWFMVRNLTHSGATHEDNWYTEMEVEEVIV